MANGKMTITDVADRIGVTPKTIMRWEKSGKVERPKRDWRRWRVYDKEDFKRLKAFKETVFTSIICFGLLAGIFPSQLKAEDQAQMTPSTADTYTGPSKNAAKTAPDASPAAATTPTQPAAPAAETKPAAATVKGGTLEIPADIPGYQSKSGDFDPVKYTLGADDVIEVTVMRHPEFSGLFPINSEGKIQYKFVGDIDVKGMTKKQVEDKLVKALSSYLVRPEVSVTITEYKSKYIFVLGEVAQPGKYYIKSDTISVRDAVVNAGLPTYSASMRKCSLITPDKAGKVKNRHVNIYAILYIGDLRRNIEMHPGEVLYVPSTVMAKIIRVISPVATTVGLASSPAEDTSTAKTAARAMAL